MPIAIYLLFLYAFSGMLFDLRTDKIPNKLLALELVGGLVYQLFVCGPMGVLSFFTGISVPFALSYVLFLFRMIGAGDIKLFMALGSVAGFPENVKIMLWSVICGGVLAVLIMWRKTGFRSRFLYLAGYVSDYMRTGVRKPYRKMGKRAENFHFTVAIFVAVVLCELFRV